MANQWYFARDGKASGPFSAAQLQELAAAGKIRPDDTVWKEGTPKKVPAAKVQGLFATPPAPPAPPPAPEPPPPPEPAPEAAAPAEPPAAPEEPPPAPEAAAPPEPEAPPEEKPAPPPAPAKVMRVLSIKGGMVSSQDGTIVKFRKKCLKCGYNDTSLTTMKIRSGTTRVNFFCPKCRKSQLTEVVGVG